MADESAADETPITFNVKSSSDAKYVLTVPLSMTVIDLKTKLSGPEYADIPPDRQRLIYSGRVLKDADTLGSYKVKEGNTVHLVKGAASNQRQNPANQGSVNAGSTGAQPATGVPTNLASGTGQDPLAGLTGARYAGYAQMPNANMFGPDGGMGPPPDPEHMASMLENPNFASTLNEALANPQVIDQMIRSNPMLRDMGPQVRQMMQDPGFRAMMTNPEALRNISQMQRSFGGGMFGGMGGGGSQAFPAPGITDTTPGQQPSAEGETATPRQPDATPQQPPNPFAMFGNPAGAGGSEGANPFAALFGPGGMGGMGRNTPGSPPPAGTQAPGATPQPGTNPIADMARNMMQNPQMMQQMMGAMGANPTANPDPNNPTANSAAQAGFNPFTALQGLGGFGGAGGFGTPPPPAPQDDRPPEDRYAEQLRQLNDMGFYEFERNIEALRRTGGSVQGAVEYLLTH
ncbi:hypothetical protein HO173_004437 [Letharia columbiana]|uniref:Uncharacterized protein n=1 Tax=Letharia columbiana TaxID=112416 RepID=A0A8H6FZC7_9LECA|nr:uncharacterized protein HO173_004437 [Letharia columbiana]KAF6237547.1 hypothetical protein HO173_004437 [Letharia columbiana]